MKLGSVTNDSPATDEPNVAPLIDIVFILLIFFVVTTTFSKELGIEVERPIAGSATEQAPNVVRVAIGRGGEVAVDGRPTSFWRLGAEVEDVLSASSEKSVLLVADQSVEAKILVEVMDVCRQVGASEIAVAVEPK